VRLSRMADYGTVVMGYMAGDPSAVHTAKGIAEAVGVGQPTVSKLLKLLSRKGVVASVRGPRGGYRFSRPPERITLAEVVEAVEGTIALTECSGTACRCTLEPGCSVRRNWRQINRQLRTVLDGVTVAELARKRGRRGRFGRSPSSGTGKPAAVVAADHHA